MSEFDNINGIYAKDVTLREGIATLRNTVTSQTIKPLTVTQNGTYTADPSEGTYGYSPITVDVQEQPWQPLEDGYSNFWFELTNDTLSPWLKFSAKNNDAVIDWGDGSGEVALDTLTPTHTYAKAGRYVVKVKGVTGIARQIQTDTDVNYLRVLTAFELNSEVSSTAQRAFWQCQRLEKYSIGNDDLSVGSDTFLACSSLENGIMPANATNVTGGMFRLCTSLTTITLAPEITTIGASSIRNTYIRYISIPSTVTQINAYAFLDCEVLSEVHCQATNPPTLGAGVFTGLPSNFIIYVPVGTADTYKAAAGWSTYADHILEEGQTPNRMMLAKFNDNNTDNEEMR